MFAYPERRRRLSDRMRAEGVDILFLGLSADLEYLSGVERGIPFFGQSSYAHGWVAGGFFRPDADPVFVLPRMVAAFDLPVRPEGEIVIVNETDDGFAVFERVARGLGAAGTVAVGDRVWAETTLNLGRVFGFDRLRTGSSLVNELRRVKTADELEAMGRACRTVEQAMAAVAPHVRPGVCMAELVEEVELQLRLAGSRTPSFATHIFTGLDADSLDSSTGTARVPMPEGTSVMFDFGGVVDGYCSDFGRTVVAGEPSQALLDAYEVMLAAYEAGRDACRPGALAREVNAACRAPIEEAGLGEHFRHRMGHGIGLDVHERPFVSSEDETPLEAGMTFTDEPSIIIPNAFSVRIENIIVCDEQGGRVLNEYPDALVCNG
jgi:Xaa-Pro aminopeptidase